MNVFVIGGQGSLADNLIVKLKKEGHRVYLLSGSKYNKAVYPKVFERYDFSYDTPSLHEIFESVRPEVTIFLGAYDTNFDWSKGNREAVRFSNALSNMLMGYATSGRGRFIFLSSEEVFGQSFTENVNEQEPTCPATIKGFALAQAETICATYAQNLDKDIVSVRFDHLYSIPNDLKDVNSHVEELCLAAHEGKILDIESNVSYGLLFENDGIEYLYRLIAAPECEHSIYHISSSVEYYEIEIGEQIGTLFGTDTRSEEKPYRRLVLDNIRFNSEFGCSYFKYPETVFPKIKDQMKKNAYLFGEVEEKQLPLRVRLAQKSDLFFKAILPFIENFVLFVPFYFLSSITAGSKIFGSFDPYLIYVLLFAIVYGQQQATVSAILSVAGFVLREQASKSGFDVMIDASTYIWVAQLFAVGLSVGYLRDQIKKTKEESEEEQNYLQGLLEDIQSINKSNVRVKDALETQIVNHSDSVGKIYRITSTLDQYSSEEVLFYAAELLGQLMKTKDVAIYIVSNGDYARLFASTSAKARSLGASIKYTATGEFYDAIVHRRVFINKQMDERYPLMANAIYEGEQMQMIVMLWGISWESMTLGQANQLTVICALIQNATLRANRYLDSLVNTRFVEGTRLLQTDAFEELVKAYLNAQLRDLTECTILRVWKGDGSAEFMYQTREEVLQDGGEASKKLRNSDYIGILRDGQIYILLPNTTHADASYVMNRFAESGYLTKIVEGDIV